MKTIIDITLLVILLYMLKKKKTHKKKDYKINHKSFASKVSDAEMDLMRNQYWMSGCGGEVTCRPKQMFIHRRYS